MDTMDKDKCKEGIIGDIYNSSLIVSSRPSHYERKC